MLNTTTFSWFQVPEDIKNLLILATQNWDNTADSEKYVNQAIEKAEDNIDVFVSAYRYFFYKNNYSLALQMALQVINKIKHSEKLPEQWNEIKPILIKRKEEAKFRLYLNASAALALVLAKLGDLEQAKKISSQVQEIDDRNEFGAKILLDILTRPVEEE